MKLFEQLKSNASRMAVYAILVATALCGIAAPVYALNGEKGDVEPAYMASTVKDRYKAFSGDTFYVAEYDTTYRQLRYNKGYDYLGAEAISYTSGWYRSNYGHITQFDGSDSCRSEKTVNLLWDTRRRGTIAEFVVLVGNQDALCADR